MDSENSNPPYFDVLLQQIAGGDSEAESAFGRHVHWGYWPSPPTGEVSPQEYDEAAERLAQLICDLAEIRSGMHVADVGCGFGGTIARLNRKASDLRATGINIDRRQLKRAADIVDPENGNHIEWVEAAAEDLPFSDASLDRILAVECIFHFDRSRFLHEAARTLRPGGSLTISDFVPNESMAQFLQTHDFAGDPAVRWTYGKVDMSCTLQQYQQLATEQGLQVSKSLDITDGTLPTYPYLLHRAQAWQNPEHRQWFTEATRRLEKASRKGLVQYLLLQFEKPSVEAPAR